MKKIYFLILVMLTGVWLMLVAYAATAQGSLSPGQTKKIDQLFEQYNQSGSPGYALGIIKNNQLVYQKGYGYANLEYDIPMTDSAMFYIGSMAKQFTAAALLILEQDGKLDFEKEVRHYLPEFPQYKYPIKVSHLVHHTSGIRETNSLQLFQGIQSGFEEVFDTDDLYQLVLNQKELNFKPGQQYRYSSGGYAVLARIVEKISGKSFRQFAKEHIFEPLQMHNTFVCDNHHEVVKNRVVSYWPLGKNKWERRSQIFDAYGDGGVITCVKDLVKWDQAFYEDKLGVKNFAQKMYQKGKLNNGKFIFYARALDVFEHKGRQMIVHNGGMLGFRVDMGRFPEEKLTIIALANSAYSHPTGKIREIADILLPVAKNDVTKQSKTPVKAVKIANPSKLATCEGYYWSHDMNGFRHIAYRDGKLYWDSGNPKQSIPLKPLGDWKFNLGDYDVSIIFRPKQQTMQVRYGGMNDQEYLFEKYDPTPPATFDEVRKYVGKYYSEELQTTYHFYIKAGKLYFRINRGKEQPLFPKPKNSRVVWNSKKMVWIGFGEIKFDVNKKGTVKGLVIGDSRVKGVYFKKLE